MKKISLYLLLSFIIVCGGCNNNKKNTPTIITETVKETEKNNADNLVDISNKEIIADSTGTKYNLKIKINIDELGPTRINSYQLENKNFSVNFRIQTFSNFNAKENDTITDIVSSGDVGLPTIEMVSSNGLPYLIDKREDNGNIWNIYIPIYNDYENYYTTYLLIEPHSNQGYFNMNNKEDMKIINTLISNCTPDHYELTDKNGNKLPKLKLN